MLRSVASWPERSKKPRSNPVTRVPLQVTADQEPRQGSVALVQPERAGQVATVTADLTAKRPAV